MYITLTTLRLRWYALATARILMRHWQAFVIAGVSVPMNTPLIKLLYGLALPLMAVLSIGHDVLWHLSSIVLIQLLALLWILVQQGNIAGKSFMAFASTLPLSLNLRRRVDLTILLFANSLLLVPFIGLLLIAPTPLVPAANKGFLLATASVLLMLILLCQLAAQERQRLAIPLLLCADCLLSWTLSHPVDGLSWVGLYLTVLSAASFLLLPLAFLPFRQAEPPSKQIKPNVIMAHIGLSPTFRLYLKAIWLQHSVSSTLRMVAVLSVAAGADSLLHVFHYDERTLPTAIIAMAVIALILSENYRLLHALRVPMQRYLASLPLPHYFWIVRDTAGVLLFGTMPLIILLVPLLMHMHGWIVLVFALAYLGLLALLRFPALHGGRQTSLLSTLLVVAWSGIAMAAVL